MTAMLCWARHTVAYSQLSPWRTAFAVTQSGFTMQTDGVLTVVRKWNFGRLAEKQNVITTSSLTQLRLGL